MPADTDPRDMRAFVQPSIRCQTTWTPAQLRAAMSSADSGELRTVGMLCEWILADDRVRKAFETRIGGLLGLDLDFEDQLPSRKKGKQRKRSRNAVVRALEDDGD